MTSSMASSLNECGWEPPWAYSGQPHAALIVRNGVDGVAISWDPRGDERAGRFIGDFLATCLRNSPESDLSDETNFLYVVLRRAPEPGDPSDVIGHDTPIAEFGFGSPPASPEAWPLVTLRTLLQTTVDSLLANDGDG
jgi:hypothetical protein